MRLWAIADLHLSHPTNRQHLPSLSPRPGDWLLLAGDVGNGITHAEWCFDLLKERFREVVWVPGNHDLWTSPGKPDGLRGQDLYAELVSIARSYGVITPEDPFPVVPHPTGQLMIVPLFLLYDYSFRSANVTYDEVLAWAAEDRIVCADEYYLHPDPFPNRTAWCHNLVERAATRLETVPRDVAKVLLSHYPLEEELAVLPRVPRFTPWCGTRRTRNWHVRFNARAAVYGHLHIRKTSWINGVPFQEVSLGYPAQWRRELGIDHYLKEIELAPSPPVRSPRANPPA